MTGRVIVHIIDPAVIGAESAAACLTPAEREQARGFHFEKDARHWTACRCALRRILGAALSLRPAAVPIEFGPFGKPLLALPSGDLHFNLSHCPDLALIALCTSGPVGIDLESAGRAPSLVGCEDAFCHPDEIVSLPEDAAARARVLLELWTAKEALLKALGTGMSLAPETVSLAPGKEDLSADLRLDHFRRHRLAHPLLSRHLACLAAPVAVDRIEILAYAG